MLALRERMKPKNPRHKNADKVRMSSTKRRVRIAFSFFQKGNQMKRFFDLTFRPFFVLTGIGTALAGLYAFWPRWTVANVAKITFVQDYTIVLQHWGIMVGLMGVFMIVAAYRTDWRKPILIYSGFEKSFMVYLVAANINQPFSHGFWAPAAMDATVVLYTIIYFAVCGFDSPPACKLSN
jgi:hypothetical protein